MVTRLPGAEAAEGPGVEQQEHEGKGHEHLLGHESRQQQQHGGDLAVLASETGEAEIESRGFFDVRDRPPVPLWIEAVSRSLPGRSGLHEVAVLVFVPEDCVAFARAGREACPNGSLYFLDWHNLLIGHMQHNARDPYRDHVHGRIYRITYPSRPSRSSSTTSTSFLPRSDS